MIFIREDIPCSLLKNVHCSNSFEALGIEINLRKTKWLLIGAYNPNKSNLVHFINLLSCSIDLNVKKFDNIIILGDFNAEVHEEPLQELIGTFDFTNLIIEPTCYNRLDSYK